MTNQRMTIFRKKDINNCDGENKEKGVFFMSLVIGLTGSIGTGKSLIAAKLKEIGIPVVDADIIAREVVKKGKPAYEKIIATFGHDILHADGTLNRQALGAIVFNDEHKRKQLNEITHPEIRK